MTKLHVCALEDNMIASSDILQHDKCMLMKNTMHTWTYTSTFTWTVFVNKMKPTMPYGNPLNRACKGVVFTSSLLNVSYDKGKQENISICI